MCISFKEIEGIYLYKWPERPTFDSPVYEGWVNVNKLPRLERGFLSARCWYILLMNLFNEFI
jgi:hypothetical protein